MKNSCVPALLADVGTVQSVDAANGKCTVDFPAQSGWSGKISEMEVASSGRSSAPSSPRGASSARSADTSAVRPIVGDLVTLTAGFATHGDAAGGPLILGREPGKLLRDDGSSKPFKVKAASGTEWWYEAGAIQKA